MSWQVEQNQQVFKVGASRYFPGTSTATQMSDAPEYTLYYWPGFAGRGEFIRLAFAVVGQPLKDMARVDAPACAPAILKLMKGEGKKTLEAVHIGGA